jgi:hypothetical protein
MVGNTLPPLASMYVTNFLVLFHERGLDIKTVACLMQRPFAID